MNCRTRLYRPERVIFYFGLFLLTLLFTACGGGGGGGGGPGGGGAPPGIGPKGGSAASDDQKAWVNIPEGVLSQETVMTVAVALNPPPGIIGIAYEFGPTGTIFSQQVTISIAYDPALLPTGIKESDLRLGVVTDGRWEVVVGSSADTVAKVVKGLTTHLGIYGIIAQSGSGVIPAPPTELTAKAGDGQVTLNWKAVPEATGYHLYIGSQSGLTKSNAEQHFEVARPFVKDHLTNGTTYYFVVTAVNAIGESAESDVVSATPVAAVTPPDPPSDLLATVVSSARIDLVWADHATNEDGFKIERKIGGGKYSEIATVGTDIAVYSDSALAANTRYCYQVRAFNSIGDSGYSSESCATTALSPPTELSAIAGNGQVTISWGIVAGATSYHVYSASVSGVTPSNYNSLADGQHHAGAGNSWIATDLRNGSTYYFIVTAANSRGESVASAELFATPHPPTQQEPSKGAIAAGDNHTCIVLLDGTLRCWGTNSSGQLGNGTTTVSPPVAVSGISTGIGVGAGQDHSCALLSDKTLLCWGDNGKGQVKGGAGNTTPVSTPFPVNGISNVIAIDGGNAHTCAALSDGMVFCWGDNSHAQVKGEGSTGSVSAPVVVSGVSTAKVVVAGGDHSCALLTTGTIRCWGDGSNGELGNGAFPPAGSSASVTGISTAVAVAAGESHTCAVLKDGKVWCWGANIFGQSGHPLPIASADPQVVNGISTATGVTAGNTHTCAVLSDGGIRCWGDNFYGQLGDGTTDSSSAPVAVTGISNAVAVAAGMRHTCAVLSDGTARCWGNGISGKLGNGKAANSSTPVAVTGISNAR